MLRHLGEESPGHQSAPSSCPPPAPPLRGAFVSHNNRDKPWLFGPQQLEISDPQCVHVQSVRLRGSTPQNGLRVLPLGPNSDSGEDTIMFVGPPQGQAIPLGAPAGLLPKAGEEVLQQTSPLALN